MPPSRHKLLFYLPSLGDGGGQRLWAALASAFHRAGHHVIFVQDFAATENRDLLDPDIALHTLGRNHLGSVGRLAAVLRETQPDVALSAIAGSNLKLIAAQKLSGVSTKIVQTFHGHNEWQTGWLSYFTARALPLTSRLSARTIAVSEPLKDDLVHTWKSHPGRTFALSNPVFLPSPISVPSADDLKSRPPVILAVGRLADDKDYPMLIEAFARLARPDARLVIVGKGPEEDNIRALISKHGLSDTVTLAGFVPEPWHHYEHAKCLALSSQSEAFGGVIVEALAHGLPIVATRTDGPKHILSSPNLGTLVPVGDAGAMAAALADALDAPGDPAPRLARANQFSMANRFPVYETLIDTVLETEKVKGGDHAHA